MSTTKSFTEVEMRNAFAKRLMFAIERSANLPDLGKQAALSREIGVTPKAVSKWLNAQSSPSALHICKLSDFLKVPKEWLLFGDGNIEQFNTSRQYPLLTTAQAGEWRSGGYLANPGENYEMISSNADASMDSFFIKIKGDSMADDFQQNDLVLIDPTLAPQATDFVLAENSTGERVFKQYKELGEKTENGQPHFELKSINELYPTLSTKIEPLRIIGVAVEHSRPLRRR